jgi:hypothetical protein
LELKKRHDKGFEVEGFREKKEIKFTPIGIFFEPRQGIYGKSMAQLLVLCNHVPPLKVKTQ